MGELALAHFEDNAYLAISQRNQVDALGKLPI
jgi:hypothetical protein